MLPPPRHDHVLALEEEAVAGGAGRDAVALELLLGRQAQPARLGAGGDDERVAGSRCRRSRPPAGTGAERGPPWRCGP